MTFKNLQNSCYILILLVFLAPDKTSVHPQSLYDHINQQMWAEKQTTKINRKDNKLQACQSFNFLVSHSVKKGQIYCLLHHQKHFQGPVALSFEWFEGGGGCRNILTDLSITALPQDLRVIDVFLRVLAVNNVEEPQESLAQGRFSQLMITDTTVSLRKVKHVKLHSIGNHLTLHTWRLHVT